MTIEVISHGAPRKTVEPGEVFYSQLNDTLKKVRLVSLPVGKGFELHQDDRTPVQTIAAEDYVLLVASKVAVGK